MMQLFKGVSRISRPVDLDIFCLYLGMSEKETQQYQIYHTNYEKGNLDTIEFMKLLNKNLRRYWWSYDGEYLTCIKKTFALRFFKLIRLYKPYN